MSKNKAIKESAEEVTRKERAEVIAKGNDALRKTGFGGKVLLTRGVADSPHKEAVMSAVHSFNDFSEDNDPHGERDNATFEVNRESWMFKVDYYDPKMEFYGEPYERDDFIRVLTILNADEY